MSGYQESDPGGPYHTRGQNSKNSTKKKKNNKKKTKDQGVGQHNRNTSCSPGFPGRYNPGDDDLGPPSVHFRMMYGPEQGNSRVPEYAGPTSKRQLLSDLFRERDGVRRSSGNERGNWYGGQHRRGAIYPGIHNEPWETYRERTQPLRSGQQEGSYGYPGNASPVADSSYDSNAYETPSYRYASSRPRNAQHRYSSDDRSRSNGPLRRGIRGFRNDQEHEDMMRNTYGSAYQARGAGRGNGHGYANNYTNNYTERPTRHPYAPQSSQNTQPVFRPRRPSQSSQYRTDRTRASDRPYIPDYNSNSFRDVRLPPSNRELDRRSFSSRKQQQPFWNDEFMYTPNHRSQEPLRSIYSIRNDVNENMDMLQGMSIDINQRYDGTRRRRSGRNEWGSECRRRDGGNGNGDVDVRRVEIPEFRHAGDGSYGFDSNTPPGYSPPNAYSNPASQHDDRSNEYNNLSYEHQRQRSTPSSPSHSQHASSSSPHDDTYLRNTFNGAYNDHDADRWSSDSYHNLSPPSSDADFPHDENPHRTSGNIFDPFRDEYGRRIDGRRK